TIDVEGLFNVRSIAGPAPWLIRAGAPEGLTFTGAATLRGLGLSTILDLREPSERSGEPADRPPHGFAVRSVPLYGTPPPQTGRLEDIYERLL
ncbi:tyrosine-protein phosphatase, partial [Staphylococcus gallinarum]|uniref:tyrosine-protein phosphatase n=1 Tax=Staphylococcus gallinarum TaxID=1293 RepID=UPI00317744EA